MVKRRRRRERREAKETGTGRPVLEEQLVLNDEMEDFCLKIKAGYSVEEISNELNISIEKCNKFLQNKVVRARIARLLDDRMPEWLTLQDELYEASLKEAIRQIKRGSKKDSDSVAFSHLWTIIKAYEPKSVVEGKGSDIESEQKDDITSDEQLNEKGEKGIFTKVEITDDEEGKLQQNDLVEGKI